MSGRGANPSRPYNDQNPIIDTTPPPAPRRRRRPGDRDTALRQARLTIELMREQGGECYWCGVAMWHPRLYGTLTDEGRNQDDRATFDHKITVSAGGKTTKENGVAACRSCNNHRGDMPFEEYEKWPT